MPIPQIFLFRDPSGALRAEAPGRNGQRRKLVVPAGQDRKARLALIEALLSDLEAQDLTIQGENTRLALASKIERVDPEAQRQAALLEAQAIRLAEWNAHLDSLSPSAREFALAKQATAREIALAKSASQARQIWLRTASEHTVELANRVIDDPKRRAGRNFKIDGHPGSFSPRTFTGDTASPSHIAKKRSKPVGPTIPGIKITL